MQRPSTIDRLRRDAGGFADSYGLLLVVILVTLLVFSIIQTGRWASLFLSLLLGATLLLALRASAARPRVVRVVLLIVAATVVLAVVGSAANSSDVRKSLSILWALALLSATLAVIRRILSHPVVTRETILGAVCAYLLIGAMFLVLLSSIQLVSGDPFFADGKTGNAPDFIYFSFVTLTTLGYGDFTPAGDFGRFTAVLEAILGQVFLVTIVARLVSLLGRERPAAARNDLGGRPPPEG